MDTIGPASLAPVGLGESAPRRWVRWAGRTLQQHWLFAGFVVLGLGLRVLVSVAYSPALELFADSYDYLRLAHAVVPGTWHPAGYPLFLTLLSVTGSLGVVVAIQHLMGIAMGVVVYVLVLRLGARRWLAAIAALPVLLDGYQVSLEQFILAETLTDLLLLGGLAALLWREDVSARRGAAVGLILAAATLTRTAIVPVMVVVALYLLLRRGHWRALLAYCAVGTVLLGAYGGWYAATYGHFGFDDFTGYYLYGRVAPFATCDYPLPTREARLCPKQPVSQRTQNAEFFSDEGGSPLHVRGLGTRHRRNALGERFAIAVIEHQPLDYAGAVLADTWHYFTPGRWMRWDRVDMQRWRFPPPNRSAQQGNYHVRLARAGFNGQRITGAPDAALTAPLRTYQSIFYTPGPLLLACLIGALGAGLGLARRGSGRQHARRAGLVLTAAAVAVVLSPSLIWGFSYRYGLPLLVLLPPAGAWAADIGLDAVARRRLRAHGLEGATGRREDERGTPTAVPLTVSDTETAASGAAKPLESH